jgi:hypothetical protein
MPVRLAGNAGPNIEVETNTLAARVVIRPDDYGSLGIYALGGVSGTMTAALGAGSPIFSFRYGGSNLAIVKKVVISAGNTATAFTAGLINFSMFAARSFSASDTGGTSILPASNTSKLRTNMATTGLTDARISSTGTLTAGTRTLDAQALAQLESSIPAVAGTPLLAPYPIFESRAGDYPLVLANNEGFVIQATVPASGTWTFAVNTVWEELSTYGTGLAA